MTEEELKQKCKERAKIFQQAMESCHSSSPIDCIEWFADRIAELKKSCDETQELLDKQIEATYKLDKENTELKEKLRLSDLENHYCLTWCSKLTKAKEIINDCVCELQNILFYKMRNKERIASTLDKAEQFLNSEVEK